MISVSCFFQFCKIRVSSGGYLYDGLYGSGGRFEEDGFLLISKARG